MAYFNNNPSFVKMKDKPLSKSDDSQLPVAAAPEVTTVSSACSCSPRGDNSVFWPLYTLCSHAQSHNQTHVPVIKINL